MDKAFNVFHNQKLPSEPIVVDKHRDEMQSSSFDLLDASQGPIVKFYNGKFPEPVADYLVDQNSANFRGDAVYDAKKIA